MTFGLFLNKFIKAMTLYNTLGSGKKERVDMKFNSEVFDQPKKCHIWRDSAYESNCVKDWTEWF